jgi:hypothetical protein
VGSCQGVVPCSCFSYNWVIIVRCSNS